MISIGRTGLLKKQRLDQDEAESGRSIASVISAYCDILLHLYSSLFIVSFMATTSTQLPCDVSLADLERHTASALASENENGNSAHSQFREPGKPPLIELQAKANPSSNDSAYASASTTPSSANKTSPPQGTWGTDTRASSTSSLSDSLSSKLKPALKKRNVKAFPDKEISEELHRRFYNLKQLYTEPLLEALRNDSGHSEAVLVKLIHLGEDESSSKPYVVAVCDKGTARKVRRLFRVRWFEEHCRDPNGVDPALQVIVYDREEAPKLFSGEHAFMASNSVYNDKERSLWGIEDERGKHLVTLGGFIDADGALLGLTCGHWKYQEREKDDTDDEEDSEDDDIIIEPPLSTLDVPMQAVTPAEPDVDLGQSFLGHLDNFDGLEYSHSGTVRATSFDQEPSGVNRDWALIDVPRSNSFWKSMDPLRSEKTLEKNQESTEHRHHEPFVPQAQRAAVLIGGGASGLISATLSFQRSLFWIPGSTDFTEVYPVSNSESSLIEGDSGAWVRDMNNKVYGHFVAGGPLNEYYIIPIEDTLASVQERLNASSVKIASLENAVTCGNALGDNELKRQETQESTDDEIHKETPPEPPMTSSSGLEALESPPMTLVKTRQRFVTRYNDSGYGSGASSADSSTVPSPSYYPSTKRQ
ncbi:MAG: hypothetical protein M1822_003857 [Bathelium mastoideum]|nr:MAG: hypothetical protein M1822_003857 [Bathelium mastoideum]